MQSFLRGFILLYPVAAIWILAGGLSPAELSLLFIVWSGSAMAFEVPSGVLADRFPRPHIMAVAFSLKALGFSIWWVFPEFAGYAAGFVLWALAGALLTGACESFLFGSLQAQHRTDAFETVYGRGDASELTGILLALGLGGYLAENGRDTVYFLSFSVPLLTAVLYSA
ncbi:MAG: MFS transporter [Gammaproteobacteria bacterium]|nr:MFS transporter [Gammaproteobacteria bacterium]